MLYVYLNSSVDPVCGKRQHAKRTYHNEANCCMLVRMVRTNQTKQPKNAAEYLCVVSHAPWTYLNHKNLYKQLWIGCISDRGIRTGDTDRYTAYHIA